ncbi:MAG: helix-turn-helix domain-containing protein [Chloroflexi bacterium]|nr:MAG: helix-turn-helix domain-containing protein [Chloroflexota bacterium]
MAGEQTPATEYLTTDEACKYLGISRTTLNIYVREGKITKYQQDAPKRVIYKTSELATFKQQVKPVGKPTDKQV